MGLENQIIKNLQKKGEEPKVEKFKMGPDICATVVSGKEFNQPYKLKGRKQDLDDIRFEDLDWIFQK